MSTWLLVALGGGAGACARYALGLLLANPRFPWATLAINIAGSLMIGALWGYAANAEWFAQWGRALLVSGLLGGFTTFSAFSLESLTLLQDGRLLAAGIYVVASVMGCLLAAWLGFRLLNG